VRWLWLAVGWLLADGVEGSSRWALHSAPSLNPYQALPWPGRAFYRHLRALGHSSFTLTYYTHPHSPIALPGGLLPLLPTFASPSRPLVDHSSSTEEETFNSVSFPWPLLLQPNWGIFKRTPRLHSLRSRTCFHDPHNNESGKFTAS